MTHRCPACGARHAERRTPRNGLERIGVALLGLRPYRCLECGRRFHDRAVGRAAAGAPAAEEPGQAGAPGEAVADAEAAAAPGVPRRHHRWVIDAGDTPLTPSQVYGLILVAAVLMLLLFLALRALWPESTGGVRGLE